jgi:hypothetical protein
MTDQEKIIELQKHLKIAMIHWEQWAEQATGHFPSEIMGEEDDWDRCSSILDYLSTSSS